MNHDAAHCADWDDKICPSDCYRAELTEELEHRSDMWYLPMSYSHFKGTAECKLANSTSDTVPVVRCRNCRYCFVEDDGYMMCGIADGYDIVEPNGYCAWGERKDDEK